jgi:hypothetical protein
MKLPHYRKASTVTSMFTAAVGYQKRGHPGISQVRRTPNFPSFGSRFYARSVKMQGYPTGRKVLDQEIKRVNPKLNKFQGEWNYTIHPETH